MYNMRGVSLSSVSERKGDDHAMMGSKARIFTPISVISLEDLVPADHFYRHLDRKLDLSFVRDLVKETYAAGGRPSIDPIVFFKLQLVMFFEDIRVSTFAHASRCGQAERAMVCRSAPCHAWQYPVTDGKN
jgi:transposase